MVYEGAEAMIRDCKFESNAASWGGALYLHDTSSTLTVSDSIFRRNTALSGGGAIDAAHCSGMLTIGGCAFESNTASNPGDGGAVALYNMHMSVVANCSFIDNTAKVCFVSTARPLPHSVCNV